MADTEIDPYLKETRILLAMSEEDRIKYVKGVMNWFSKRLQYILDAPSGIQMNKRLKSVSNQWAEQAEELMTCALWTIKGDYRSDWMELLGSLVGMHKASKGK